MKRAFSLIELSVVILIIGILVAGVTQSSRLVNQMRLNSARAQTQSSPVAGIKDLVLWLEATSENSFITTEAGGGSPLTAWYDTNPQAVVKNHATRVTSNANVTYEDNAINSLPGVYFNGTAATTSNLAGNVITSHNNAFSFFLVSRLTETTTGNWRGAFFNGSSGGWGYQKDGLSPSKRDLVFPGVVDSYSTTNITTNAELISATHTGTTTALYLNGANEGPSTTSASMNSPVSQYIVGNHGTTGATPPWMGYLCEIIVFDRALKTEERRAVEAYLGKKWGIRVI